VNFVSVIFVLKLSSVVIGTDSFAKIRNINVRFVPHTFTEVCCCY